ncbi:helix-turn-helix domain-containing protein [Peribacillus frigoritolerans]|nr:helix-turn-helix domain-containing protein [Peribacillus frigoritolerans]
MITSGGDLIHTLTFYIRNQGNVSQTARTLHIHRHTLLYRLKKIETLTGRFPYESGRPVFTRPQHKTLDD